MAPHTSPQIAVVGGGIVGIILARGLVQQGISVRVYEQAASFREIGAGIAFSACARRCMELIDTGIVAALKRCGAVSVSDENEADDYLRWIDGYNLHDGHNATYQRPLAQIGGAGFTGCRRDQFLEELVSEMPPGLIEFGKRLVMLEDQPTGPVILTFTDGTSAEAHAVIGCDGVKSRVRKYLFGPDHGASHAQYTQHVAYRGLVSMSRAVEVLGRWKAHNFHHHVGPGAHLTHYPVANNAALNVAIFVSDPEPWPDQSNMVTQGRREDVESLLAKWHPTVRSLVRLLPDTLMTWGLFDLAEFPAPVYCTGRVCIAGDAAHASSPHHGAGACLGVEDALCLNVLLGHVYKTATKDPVKAMQTAFETFDSVRRPRTQWLVNSSRRVCDLYHQSEWADPRRWTKAETCFEEIRDRSYKIWNFDVEDMVQRTLAEYERKLRGVPVDDKHGYRL
ncbi:FAD/NAD(P)-binding domain-containing protein [Aspergillus brunneoviolaceus CBS 621.78]|uniref:FAD/NAD(P)-binding domain-containing protein n=1 Tax=Aspergillus brunneoviolaceus CBS 621.78 TaxID=1450534 RepID=A0ACD1G685_9EURO|nr:FAD/NAD(P)-binding domain-containing protein [Aspergillus brunneoviolaceus CBS 621.78]RAH44772.1 FAD/NAD(P)-binding domain-containing protein [Aspergillus brunneoviolaceus CBS 621.78]